MPAFAYRAARRTGAIEAGVIHAASATDAGDQLRLRDLFPISLAPRRDQAERRSAPTRELAVLFRSIAALVSAGVPIERAVDASRAIVGEQLRTLLGDVRQGLREGMTLATALDAGRGLIPSVVLSMIRSGESASQLPTALEYVATSLEAEAELGSRVRQALAYPLLLLVAGIGTITVMVGVVVPRFTDLLGNDLSRLPASTRALLALSALLTGYWPVWLATIGVTGAALIQWSRTAAGRRSLHATMLSLPIVGGLRLTLASARWSRALAGALSAGMPLLPALDATRNALGDDVLQERAQRARDRVSRGEPFATALSREGVVTPTTIQLFTVGESSGALALMAERAGRLGATESERQLRTLVSMLEPLLVMLLGGAVAFVAAALLQAVYGIRPDAL